MQTDAAHTAEEAAAITPPRGFAWAWNRRAEDWEFMYDGQVYAVPGHGAVLLPDKVAQHGRKRGVEKIDVILRTVQRRIAVRYHPQFGETNDPEFGVPLGDAKPLEVLDRASGDNPFDAPTRDGVKTHAKVIPVTGAGMVPDARHAPELR